MAAREVGELARKVVRILRPRFICLLPYSNDNLVIVLFLYLAIIRGWEMHLRRVIAIEEVIFFIFAVRSHKAGPNQVAYILSALVGLSVLSALRFLLSLLCNLVARVLHDIQRVIIERKVLVIHFRINFRLLLSLLISSHIVKQQENAKSVEM